MSYFTRARRPSAPAAKASSGQGFVALLAVLGVLAGLTALPARKASASFIYDGTLLVGNRFANDVLRIDPTTDTVVQTINDPDFAPPNVISDVQVDDLTGNIFVAVDLFFDGAGGAGEVVEFDPFGNFLQVVPLPLDGPGGGAFFYPFGIDVDRDGSVWAARPNSGEIAHVAANNTVSPPVGTVLGLFTVGGHPADVHVAGTTRPGVVFISYEGLATPKAGTVDRLDTVTSTLTSPFAATGQGVAESVEVPDEGADGLIRVSTGVAGTIQHFDIDTGAPVFPGLIAPAGSVDLADTDQQLGGNIFASEPAFNRILVFNAAGAPLGALTGGGAV